jgi:hypothetical protein
MRHLWLAKNGCRWLRGSAKRALGNCRCIESISLGIRYWSWSEWVENCCRWCTEWRRGGGRRRVELNFLVTSLITREPNLIIAMRLQGTRSGTSSVAHPSVLVAALLTLRSIFESFLFKGVGGVPVNCRTYNPEV